jgi:hypothetical protein
MSRRKCSTLVWALGLALVAGCGGGGEPAGQDASATITATATVTATANAATPPGELRPFSPTKVFSDLVEREYPPKSLRNIAQAICEEVRTGDPDTSLPWRELIGYLGERRVGAFIAYSVVTYCPKEGDGLIDLMDANLSQGG